MRPMLFCVSFAAEACSGSKAPSRAKVCPTGSGRSVASGGRVTVSTNGSQRVTTGESEMTKPSKPKDAAMEAAEGILDNLLNGLEDFLPTYLGFLGYTVSPSGKIKKNSRRKSVDLNVNHASDLAILIRQVLTGYMEARRNEE